MSLGKVNYDMHYDTITLKPENAGFEFGRTYSWQSSAPFYENSKDGLKKFLKDRVFGNTYPLLYMSQRVYFKGEEAKKQEEAYNNALDRVIWTDNPDVSFLPNYDTRTQSKAYTTKFELTTRKKVGGKNGYYENVPATGIKGEVSRYLNDLTAGGKDLVINSIKLVHTQYIGMNDKEVQIDFTVLTKEEKKDLIQVRENIKAEEDVKAKAEEAAKQAKLKAEEDAKNAALEIIKNSEFGKNLIKTSEFDRIVRWVAEGKLTEQFLNAKNITDLIPEEKMKDKDFMRVADILKKSDIRYAGNDKSLLAGLDIGKARKLALNQGSKIKDEAKRQRRKDAANSIGAGFIACCF